MTIHNVLVAAPLHTSALNNVTLWTRGQTCSITPVVLKTFLQGCPSNSGPSGSPSRFPQLL